MDKPRVSDNQMRAYDALAQTKINMGESLTTLDSFALDLLDARRRIAELEQALMVSEEYRVAYEKGKNELYAMGGEICEAAAKHLPCGEGPLNRYTRKVEREHSPQLLQQNKELVERIAELEKDAERWKCFSTYGTGTKEGWDRWVDQKIAAQRQKEGE